MRMHNCTTFVAMFALLASSLVVGQLDREEVDDQEIDVARQWRPTVRCVSGRDCGTGQCSVMGMQRFAEPRCEALSREGDFCRMGAEPDNKTLHFPHATMVCEDVYMQFCPCGGDLVCYEAKCTSQKALQQQQQVPAPTSSSSTVSTPAAAARPSAAKRQSRYPWASAARLFH